MENFSFASRNLSYHDKYLSKLSPWMDDVIAIYLLVLGILTILFNFVVLLTAAKRKRSCSPLELYVVNLAAGDLLVGMSAYPVHVWMAFKHSWMYGMPACKVYAATVYFFGTSSILTLATMSGLRYIKTCHPSADRYIGRPSVYATLVIIYGNAGVWAGGPLLGWGAYEVEPFGLSCTLDWYHPSLSYIVCAFLSVYILPIVLMACCYGRMIYHVHITQKHMMVVNNRLDQYLTKMTGIMCGCFLFAWTPYAIVSLCYVSHSYELVPISLATAAPFFAKSATCYNPIVYFFAVKRFREEVKEVVFPSCLNTNVENKTLSMQLPMTCEDASTSAPSQLKPLKKHKSKQIEPTDDNTDMVKQALMSETDNSAI